MKKKSLVRTLALAFAMLCVSTNMHAQKNGQLWPDVDGRHINAHGGNIIKYGDKYYWYGENRPDRGFTTEVGVGVYSSTDLRNWKDEGVALAVSEEAGADIERGCIMERPKVLHNPKTGKFVMLFHLELKGRGYEAARVAFAVSDTPTGPFKFLRSTRVNAGIWPFDFTEKQIAEAKQTDASAWKDWWTPAWRKETSKGMYLWRDMEGGQMSRDMTVYVDDDGKAYHITSSQENLTLLVNELTDDYLGFTGKYNMIAPGGQNEAPTIFKRDGKYWLICSGCTGWDPNEARMFVSHSIWGPWKQLPSPFTGPDASIGGQQSTDNRRLSNENRQQSVDNKQQTTDNRQRRAGAEDDVRTFPANKTFGAQGTYILTQGERLFFMADIWNPRHLSRSLHVWLPIDFASDGTPVIKWVESPFNLEK